MSFPFGGNTVLLDCVVKYTMSLVNWSYVFSTFDI